MYAVIKTGGKQYKVTPGEVLRVERLDAGVGSQVELNEVLLFSDGSRVEVGRPFVEGAVVKAEVLGHGKGKKVVVMKKKRRKGYKVKRGHRQPYTSLEVKEIKA